MTYLWSLVTNNEGLSALFTLTLIVNRNSFNLYVSPDSVFSYPAADREGGYQDRTATVPLLRVTPSDPARIVALGSPLFSTDEKEYIYSQVRELSVLYVATGLK